MNMEDGEEMNVWRESCQFNHPSSYPSAKICKTWVEHKKNGGRHRNKWRGKGMEVNGSKGRKTINKYLKKQAGKMRGEGYLLHLSVCTLSCVWAQRDIMK